MNKWDYLVISMIIASALVKLYTNMIRSQQGLESWYNDPYIITVNEISGYVLMALLISYLVAVVVKKALE